MLAGCGSEGPGETQIAIGRDSLVVLDPALASRPEDTEALWLVYTPLLTYRRAEGVAGTELIPGLAADLPEVSSDGRTYLLKLRDGLEYSNGDPVMVSDFERAIARSLRSRTETAVPYQGIVGASEYAESDAPGAEIAGIEANNDTGEVKIELTEPEASFSEVLALISSAPVPSNAVGGGASRPPPGVGPYEIAEIEPDRVVLERNEGFGGFDIPDVPTGNIGTITIRLGGSARSRAQAVLDDRLDYTRDLATTDLRSTIREQAPERYQEHPVGATVYFSLDKRFAPFDDPLVREAVNRAIDKPGLADVTDGLVTPGCAFLAPGTPGYDRELDTTQCPYGHPDRPPDLGPARDLIKQARAEGERVTVWSGGSDPVSAVSHEYARTLDRIGLDAEVQTFESNPDPGAPAGAGSEAVTSGAPPSGPAEAFTLLTGRSPAATAAGNVYDPYLEAEIGRLRAEPAASDAAAGWRELDRYLVSPPQSYVAVFGHLKAATFLSERIDPQSAIFHPVYGNDYSSWSLKEGE